MGAILTTVARAWPGSRRPGPAAEPAAGGAVQSARRSRSSPMLAVVLLCIFLVVVTTLVHYEVLAVLSARLPGMRVAPRLKLVVVVLASFAAHAGEIALYALAAWASIALLGIGQLSGSAGPGFLGCLYFSAETFTSLGFGDIVPGGPLRLLAGVETLNGLLLIGWSASYIYISMERFWDAGAEKFRRAAPRVP